VLRVFGRRVYFFQNIGYDTASTHKQRTLKKARKITLEPRARDRCFFLLFEMQYRSTCRAADHGTTIDIAFRSERK
jgi:hypothetical protein